LKTERSFETQVVINQVSGYGFSCRKGQVIRSRKPLLFYQQIARIVEDLPRLLVSAILGLPFRTGGGKIIEANTGDFRL
jgi:hypothetical protein